MHPRHEAAAADLAARLKPGDVVLVTRRPRHRQDDVRARRLPRARRDRPGDEPDVHDRPGLRRRARRPEIAHLDLYRLESLAGEDPALLDDYLTPERIAFVEWPGIAEPELERPRRRARDARASGGDRRVLRIDRVNVLGFDTSTNATQRLRAARRRRGVRARPGARARCSAVPATRAELMPAVERVMDEAGVGWDDVDAIAVGVGPGHVHRPADRHRHGARARARARDRGAAGVVARRARRAARPDPPAAGADRRAPRRAVRRAARADGGERWAPFVDAARGAGRAHRQALPRRENARLQRATAR